MFPDFVCIGTVHKVTAHTQEAVLVEFLSNCWSRAVDCTFTLPWIRTFSRALFPDKRLDLSSTPI